MYNRTVGIWEKKGWYKDMISGAVNSHNFRMVTNALQASHLLCNEGCACKCILFSHMIYESKHDDA